MTDYQFRKIKELLEAIAAMNMTHSALLGGLLAEQNKHSFEAATTALEKQAEWIGTRLLEAFDRDE